MRAAFVTHRHFSSEVVTKAQCAPRFLKRSVSPGTIEEISERASVESCFIFENRNSRIRHYLSSILYLLIIQLWANLIIHHTDVNTIKSSGKAAIYPYVFQFNSHVKKTRKACQLIKLFLWYHLKNRIAFHKNAVNFR